MNKHNRHPLKTLLAAGLCGLGLWAGGAAAHGDLRHQARALDLKGDRIAHRLDRKGDRIAARLEHRADHLRAQGRYGEARRLEREAHRIDRRLDRKGERIDRRLDRRAARLYQQWYDGHHDRHRGDHRDYRPVYHDHRSGGVTVSVDLGRWVIRP